MQKIWRLLVPGKRKINLFSISFFCSHACVLPPGQRLHTALNTQLRISIEASFVVLVSCVIELRIYIGPMTQPWGPACSRGSLRAVVRGWAYGTQVRSRWVLTGVQVWLRISKTVRRKGLCLLQLRTRHRRGAFQQMVRRSAATATVTATASSRAC